MPLLGETTCSKDAMDADDSARMRDLLASNRTLLAWVRTSVSFAGLGFIVARFGRTLSMERFSAAVGIFMVFVGLVISVVGYAQHWSVRRQEEPPPGAPAPPAWPAGTAAILSVPASASVVSLPVSTAPWPEPPGKGVNGTPWGALDRP